MKTQFQEAGLQDVSTSLLTGVRGVSRILIMGFPTVRNYRNIFGISSDQLLRI